MKDKKLKVLFAGTADFAIPSFKMLLQNPQVEVVGLLTQPDRPVGRKQELKATPVKQFLKESGWAEKVPVFAPERLSIEAGEILLTSSPDLVVVAAYGQFIPNSMLSGPKLGAINIHGSLLPELRGAVPVQMAILQGLEKTGVTIQKMVKEMDAGDVYVRLEKDLDGTETTESLMAELAELGATALEKLLPNLMNGKAVAETQDSSLASYCYQRDIAKENAEITARTSADLAERMVRAFYPWPVAWLVVQNGSQQGKRLKIFSSKLSNSDFDISQSKSVQEGELFVFEKNLFLKLANGNLQLLEVQLEGKQRRAAEEYLWLVG